MNLNRDPVGTVEKIYNHFDLPLSRTAQKRMHVWLGDNPRSKFGSHVCSAAELGMDPEREKERFRFYIDRFNLTCGGSW